MNQYARYKYLIEIAGDSSKDFDYHSNHIKNIIQKLFNIKPNFRTRNDQNTLYTQIISKRIFGLLESKGMPRGRKSNLKVPDWIKNDYAYSIAFVRGLFDTDGSLILRKRKQNSVSWGFKDEKLTLELKSILEELGYFVAYNKEKRLDKRGFISVMYVIRINRKKHIQRFVSEVGSSNPYKIRKFEKVVVKNGNAGI